jgi:hypothetical protein
VNDREAAELQMDALLGIRTTGRDESGASVQNNPYEPTPYAVLDRLVSSGHVRKNNLLVDYGCGKGRVGFYLSYQAKCRSLGIERDPWLFEAAQRNLARAARPGRVSFEQADARTFVPPAAADRFYFFNPFSVEVFADALRGIEASLVAAPRPALLVLYYPDDAYLELLDASARWAPLEPIPCGDLFDETDPRERLVVYAAS